MSRRNQQLCTWSGALFATLFLIGFGIVARYIPPPLPTETAAEVAQRYRDNSGSIRAGMVITLFGLMFYVTWSAAISVHLRRIEGRHTPLTFAQLGLGTGLSVAFILVMYFFVVAGFRPDRPDEIVRVLNDLGWVPFTGVVYTIFAQNLVIGVAVLGDRRPSPVLPRWFGYFSIWIAIAYCPACLDAFFTDGPFAWNGVFTWWLSVAAFLVYIVVTTRVLLEANKEIHDDVQLEPVVGEKHDSARS